MLWWQDLLSGQLGIKPSLRVIPMCLGVPGQVVSLDQPSDGLVMGKVSFGGVEREVCFGFASEAKLGDYVLVHVGFAIAVLDEAEAQRILEDF